MQCVQCGIDKNTERNGGNGRRGSSSTSIIAYMCNRVGVSYDSEPTRLVFWLVLPYLHNELKVILQAFGHFFFSFLFPISISSFPFPHFHFLRSWFCHYPSAVPFRVLVNTVQCIVLCVCVLQIYMTASVHHTISLAVTT